jgi:cysteine desulfurase/selenocysteine lyase
LASVYQLGTQLHDNSVIEFAPREGAKRFEFWESSISSRLGLGEAVCVAMDKGLTNIYCDIQHLSALLRNELEETIPGICIHHKNTTTCGIVTFSCENADARTIQATMWKEGFELSMVPTTSTPLDSSSTNVPDLVRASISYTTTEKDILSFCRSLASFLK